LRQSVVADYPQDDSSPDLRIRQFRGFLPDRRTPLVEADVLPESSSQEISEAYEFLMRLRLQRQAEALSAGQTPDNILNYRRLSQLEQTLLNQSFAQIAAVQKRISYDFLGDTA